MFRTIALMASLSFLFACSAQAQPEVVAPRMLAPPVLDGLIQDSEWKNAVFLSKFHLFQGTKNIAPVEDERTTAWIGCDRENLFIAFRCKTLSGKALPLRETAPDQPVHGDSVEVFLNPAQRSMVHYQFQVSPGGGRYDCFGGDDNTSVDGGWGNSTLWHAASTLDEMGYSVEMCIPFRILASDGSNKFRFNLTRNATEYNQLHTFSPMRGATWRRPRFFAFLEIPDLRKIYPVSVERLNLSPPIPGFSHLQLIFTNHTENSGELKLKLERGQNHVEKNITIPEGDFFSWSLPDPFGTGNDVLTCQFSGRVFLQSQLSPFLLAMDAFRCKTSYFSTERIKGHLQRSLPGRNWVKARLRKGGNTIELPSQPYTEFPDFGILEPGLYHVEITVTNDKGKIQYVGNDSFLICRPYWE